MEYLFSIIDKIFFILLIMSTGMLSKRLNWLTDQGEKDLGNLMIDFFWPSLIFTSVVTTLNVDDIMSNITLPLLCFLIHIVGRCVPVACR